MMSTTPPSEADVNARVREIEDRLDLFSLTIDGVSLWQLVRFEVSIRQQRGGLARAPLQRRRLIRSLWSGLYQYVVPSRSCRYLCKTFDSAHRGQGDTGMQDIYFDTLCAAVPGGAKMSSYDAAGFERNASRSDRPPVFDDTSVILASALLGRVWPYTRSHHVFDRLADAIASEFGFRDYTAKRLARIFNVFRWRAGLYQRVLRKFSPEMVLAPDSGQFALMKACDEANIPFVELQHGVFTAAHPNSLPSALKGKPGILEPAALAAYGDFTRNTLSGTLLHEDNRIVSVGGPAIERFRQLRDKEFKSSETIVITLTTQGIAGASLVALVRHLLERGPPNVLLNLKLHPAYDLEEERYRDQFGDAQNVRIFSGKSRHSVHELIAFSDLHLSISSASHYDALGIGTPTGVLKMETHQSVAAILNHEGAFLVADPDALVQMLLTRQWPKVPVATKNHFFQGNYIANMSRLMQRHMDQSSLAT